MPLRLIDKSIIFPKPYPKVTRKLPTVKDEGWTKVDGFTLRKGIDFIPQVGMQESVCACESNLIFMCGQATSGKTFTMYLKALGGVDKFGFTSRIISVRAVDSQKGSSIFRDGVTVLGNFSNCDYSSSGVPTFSYPQWNSNLQLIHSNFNVRNPAEWKLFQDYAKKQQSSLIMVDEATEMEEFKMFAYWFMRNRDNSGMIPQMICSFNPLYGHWTNDMLIEAGYIDTSTWHLQRDMIGKTRYFYVKGDDPHGIIWGDTRKEVADAAGLRDKPEDVSVGITRYDYVKSFTVFTANAADNRELVHATGGQSVANLHAVGATQRAVIGEAYFGPIENEENSVSRKMILNLWENPEDNDEIMYATMDVSSGKAENDKSPMIIWRGHRAIAVEFFSGEPTEMSGWIKRTLEKYNVPISNFAYDATGHGYWMQGLTDGIPITWNKRVMQEYDQFGNPVTLDEFFNLRSQLLGKTEVLLKSGILSCSIPQDTKFLYGRKGETRRFLDVLFDEMALFNKTTKNKKTYYRSTDEFKEKFHFSPDIMTTIGLRAVFDLDARPRKQAAPEVRDDAYDDFYSNNYDTTFFDN
jgi:hypothetical protein